MKKLLAVLLLAPALAVANVGGVPVERAQIDLHDKLSLQRGAQIFVNHCLNCHSASAMRYTRLADRLWRFEGLEADFVADLPVDGDGVVLDYPGLFRRLP